MYVFAIGVIPLNYNLHILLAIHGQGRLSELAESP